MKQLEHDNILSLCGISTTVADLCLVFPWYENGNIVDYLKKTPDANRFDLVSAFEQALCSRYLLVPTNSYQVRSAGCASCTITAWFTAH